MNVDSFKRQPRGPQHFDLWLRDEPVSTTMGELPLEILTAIDATPSQEALSAAMNLEAFAKTRGHYVLDLIHGHYRRAETKDWLTFWDVPLGLARLDILTHLSSIRLMVDEDLSTSVLVNPEWDPEHKLSLTVEGSVVVEVNDEPFELVDGILLSS